MNETLEQKVLRIAREVKGEHGDLNIQIVEFTRRLAETEQGESESLERRMKEWAALEVAIKDYMAYYEYGEDGYEPSDQEKEICYDFLHGLLADDPMLDALSSVYPIRSRNSASPQLPPDVVADAERYRHAVKERLLDGLDLAGHTTFKAHKKAVDKVLDAALLAAHEEKT